MFPPKSPFRALFGAFYPHPAHQSALRAEGLRTSWHPVNVGAPPSPWPLFSRLPPHTAVRRHAAGSSYEPTLPRWLLPDADTRIGKEPTESDRDDRPLSLVWHQTGRSRRQKPSVELRIPRALQEIAFR